jgi:prevent-host-death family protein
MTHVSIEEAQGRLTELIAAATRGEEVIIAADGRPAVKLVPVELSRQRRKPGSAKGLIVMSDDFDEPLEDFNEYMP